MWPSLPFLSLYLFYSSAVDARLFSNSFGLPFVNATFDYVVVGGGNGGVAIASRLAEHYSVALIEAGGFYDMDNGNGSVVAGLAGGQHTGTSLEIKAPLIDWDFSTIPQAGADNRVFRYARGKTLGGCSARNYMAYHRPTKGSFKKWADEVGDESYTWDGVLPYFERSTQITAPDYSKRSTEFRKVAADLSHFGKGPVHVSWPNYVEPLGANTIDVYEKLGMKENKGGFSGGNLLGFGYATFAINPHDGTRSSSYTSYLKNAMEETDLKIYHRTLAKQILFTEDKAAHAVKVETVGIPYTLFANKEVILSAGTFQSPQMLMVSGIGPRRILDPLGIDVLVDLPGVGQNMQDHPFVAPAFPVTVPTVSRLFLDPEYYYRSNEQFLANASGPLSSPSGPWAWERYPSTASKETRKILDEEFPSDWPHLEHIALSAYLGDYTGTVLDPFDGKNYGSMMGILVAPMSRGNISIASADAAEPPLINPNWLTHAVDKEMIVAVFRRAREIWNKLSILDGEEYYPGKHVQSDEDILAMARKGLATVFHASSTCKMGKAPGDESGDRMGVVDTKARVYGVKGLRVVDASIMPFLPPGHPMATVYMLAEKIADDIIKAGEPGSEVTDGKVLQRP
ncbi:alcohol oxidase [Rhizodiscina lignyota]|uniref:Alcohol oxidase n=1 Tax=Rhizodiscina lignyota TaxID=1504668 RepID=A0A9P4IRB1_9PEZI|nr:alcohol oxidase [Rhizodiscina lignyota]